MIPPPSALNVVMQDVTPAVSSEALLPTAPFARISHQGLPEPKRLSAVEVTEPVNVGLEIVGLVARTAAPEPVVPLLRSAAEGCEQVYELNVAIAANHWCVGQTKDDAPFISIYELTSSKTVLRSSAGVICPAVLSGQFVLISLVI